MLSIDAIRNVKRVHHLKIGDTLKDVCDLITKHSFQEVPIIDSRGHATATLDVFRLIRYLVRTADKENDMVPECCVRHRLNTIDREESIHNAAYFPVDRFVLDSEDKYIGLLTRADVIGGLIKELEVYNYIFDQIEPGIGILSKDEQLLYQNRKFEDTLQTDKKKTGTIPLKEISSVIPQSADVWGNVPVRYHYNKAGFKGILEYFPILIEKKYFGTLIILYGDQKTQQSDVVTSPHPAFREMKEWKEVREAFPNIVISDPKMEQVVRLALKAARITSNVLITGKTGVGKEIIAEIVHRMGSRADRPLIKVNCAAIPESLLESELFGYEKGAFTGAVEKGKIGLIEAADQGSLFLDEINSLPMNLQAKLLRFLQNQEFYKLGGTRPHKADVRIIVASNWEIKKLVDQGDFREDLYYRLCVIPIHIPELKKRPKDIIPLSMFFLQKYNELYNLDKQLNDAAYNQLLGYDWPGNVRELQHLIEQLVVLTDTDVIDSIHLLEDKKNDENAKQKIEINILRLIPLKEAHELLEQAIFKEAQKQFKSVRDISKKLEVHHSTVVRKINQLKKKQNNFQLMSKHM
ncbi:sigma 54-interacting transcriptional regulator [Desulfosarcina widdelii]|uniref:sigma 54-interacting transcriptional regulator n=1 Tax=Desulfosarcina widdelii TaxID=947919 RepID=UPI0012D2A36B|nr:sigma 54-interacting transcriptional regulator [Desulfosarcina widdelii]